MTNDTNTKGNEMTQRKLTADERSRIDLARSALSALPRWSEITGGEEFWIDALMKLSDMATHGTADGRPYVEPTPEIGEWYRLATEADSDRLDLEVVIHGGWTKTGPGICEGFTYRVPVDRIPTDEDARQRPTVMVRDSSDGVWAKGTLYARLDVPEPRFYAQSESIGKGVTSWKIARFPYPGELE